jgi:hypothetical protein
MACNLRGKEEEDAADDDEEAPPAHDGENVMEQSSLDVGELLIVSSLVLLVTFFPSW